jgi:hypothetical protein
MTAALHISEAPKPEEDFVQARRHDFSRLNAATAAARIAFPIAVRAALLPFVWPCVALTL